MHSNSRLESRLGSVSRREADCLFENANIRSIVKEFIAEYARSIALNARPCAASWMYVSLERASETSFGLYEEGSREVVHPGIAFTAKSSSLTDKSMSSDVNQLPRPIQHPAVWILHAGESMTTLFGNGCINREKRIA